MTITYTIQENYPTLTKSEKKNCRLYFVQR